MGKQTAASLPFVALSRAFGGNSGMSQAEVQQLLKDQQGGSGQPTDWSAIGKDVGLGALAVGTPLAAYYAYKKMTEDQPPKKKRPLNAVDYSAGAKHANINADLFDFGKSAGFRWYKRFPVNDNLALNLSLGGPSLTVKKLIPGTSFTLGNRAPRLYVGTPIPGLAYQQYMSPKKHKITAEKEFKDDPKAEKDERTTYEKVRDFFFGSEYGSEKD
jgi:hypothetical protein